MKIEAGGEPSQASAKTDNLEQTSLQENLPRPFRPLERPPLSADWQPNPQRDPLLLEILGQLPKVLGEIRAMLQSESNREPCPQGLNEDTFPAALALANGSLGEQQALYRELEEYALVDNKRECQKRLCELGFAAYDAGFRGEGIAILREATQRYNQADYADVKGAIQLCEGIVKREIEPLIGELPAIISEQLRLTHKRGWYSVDRALESGKLSEAGIAAVEKFYSEHALDCDFAEPATKLFEELAAAGEYKIEKDNSYDMPRASVGRKFLVESFKEADWNAVEIAKLASIVPPTHQGTGAALREIAKQFFERAVLYAEHETSETMERYTQNFSDEVDLQQAVNAWGYMRAWPESEIEQRKIIAEIEQRIEAGCGAQYDPTTGMYAFVRKIEDHPYAERGMFHRDDIQRELTGAIYAAFSDPALTRAGLPLLYSLDKMLPVMSTFQRAAGNLPEDFSAEEMQTFVAEWKKAITEVALQVVEDSFVELSTFCDKGGIANGVHRMADGGGTAEPSRDGSHFVCDQTAKIALFLLSRGQGKGFAEGIQMLMRLPQGEADLQCYIEKDYRRREELSYEASHFEENHLLSFNQCQFKAEKLLEAAALVPASENAMRRWLIGEAQDLIDSLEMDPAKLAAPVFGQRLACLYKLRCTIEEIGQPGMLEAHGRVAEALERGRAAYQGEEGNFIKRWELDYGTRLLAKRAIAMADCGQLDEAKQALSTAIEGQEPALRGKENKNICETMRETLYIISRDARFSGEAAKLAALLGENIPRDSYENNKDWSATEA